MTRRRSAWATGLVLAAIAAALLWPRPGARTITLLDAHGDPLEGPVLVVCGADGRPRRVQVSHGRLELAERPPCRVRVIPTVGEDPLEAEVDGAAEAVQLGRPLAPPPLPAAEHRFNVALESEQGEPLVGRLAVHSTDPWQGLRAVPGVVVTPVAPGRYAVTVPRAAFAAPLTIQGEADGYVGRAEALDPANPEITLRLGAGDAPYAFKVLGCEGAPLAGASAALTCSAALDLEVTVHQARSGAGGEVVLSGIGAGSLCQLSVEAAGASQVESLGTRRPASVVVCGAGRWSGTVREARSGRPIAGATVRLLVLLDPSLAARTDDRGRFAIEGVPLDTPFVWEVVAPGFTPAAADNSLELTRAARAKQTDIEMLAAATLGGRVLDEAGGPIVGARVTAVHAAGGAPGLSAVAMTTTDPAGRFLLATLSPGAVWTVSATEPGYAEAQRYPVDPAVTPHVELVLRAAATVRGTARFQASGRPAAGWILRLVSAAGPSGGVSSTRTGEDGAFVMTGVHPGRHQLTAAPEGGDQEYLAELVLEPTQELTHDLAVPDRGALEGEVAHGGRAAPASVELSLVRSGVLLKRTAAIVAQRYHVSDLPPGEWEVEARIEGCAPLRPGAVRLSPAVPTRLDLSFDGGAQLVGSVTEASTKRPVGGATIGVRPCGATPEQDPEQLMAAEATSAADGTFRLQGLKGRVCIEARHPDYALWVSAVELRDKESTVPIALMAPAQLRIGVRDSNGQPLGDLQVTLQWPDRRTYSHAFTDADGEARFERLAEGTYDLWFVATEGERAVTVERRIALTTGATRREEIVVGAR